MFQRYLIIDPVHFCSRMGAFRELLYMWREKTDELKEILGCEDFLTLNQINLLCRKRYSYESAIAVGQKS